MLQEFVNNPKYLVKIGFGPWSILKKPIKFDIDTRVLIKIRCEHKNYYRQDGMNLCENCGESIGDS